MNNEAGKETTAMTNSERIQKIVSEFPNKHVLVVGDVMLDRTICGPATRLCPEAPVPVIEVRPATFNPGGAGNVAMNLADLRAQVTITFVGGKDDETAAVMHRLMGAGVTCKPWLSETARMTTKTRVYAQSSGARQMLCRIDLDSACSGDDRYGVANEVIEVLMKNPPDAIIVSDYAKGAVCEVVMDVVRRFKGPVVVDPKRDDWSLYRGATCVCPNEKELNMASRHQYGEASYDFKAEAKMAGILSKTDHRQIVTMMGANGCVLVDKYPAFNIGFPQADVIRGHKVKAVDVSGAGDTFISVYALSLVSGATPQEAAFLANVAGAVVVQKEGVATVTADEIARLCAQCTEGGGP